jgi:PPP family 3-phenylpropionic acid transporter
MGGGRLLEGRGTDVIFWGILGAYVLTFVFCLTLPRDNQSHSGPDEKHEPSGAKPRPMRHMLAQPGFVLFLVAASLIQATHSVLYGFGTLHWRAAGIDGTVIGWLWAEGVIAEIILFAFSGIVVRWVGPTRLLIIAGAAAALRWSVTAETTSLPILVVMQVLHGLTFGAAHLGAMHYIARAAPVSMAATAQVLYSSVALGAAFGLGMPAAGWLYGSLGGGAFHVMAVAGAFAMLCAITLHRQPQRAMA